MELAHAHISAPREARSATAPALIAPVAVPDSLLAQSLIGPDTSIRTLIERFTTRLVQIGLVVDEQQQKLIGTVTDGDLRRGLAARGSGPTTPSAPF